MMLFWQHKVDSYIWAVSKHWHWQIHGLYSS